MSVLRVAAHACGVTTLLASLVTSAAACDRWTLPSTFRIQQGNGLKVSCDLAHSSTDGDAFKGACEYGNNKMGIASGRLEGRQFHMDVRWSTGSVGKYTAFIKGEESAAAEDGRTFDAKHPARWSTWTSTTPATCRH